MPNDVFRALDDPTRRQILEMLAEEGELSAGEITARFNISAPSISHHLSILRVAGLVCDTRRRQSIVYSLYRPGFRDAAQWITAMQNGNDAEK